MKQQKSKIFGSQNSKVLKKEIFPNTATILNILCGLISIFLAIKGLFVFSAIALLVAVVFDYLDGKLARCLKAESKLGEELDSLADLVSFGVAPAIMVYLFYNNDALAILVALMVLAGAYRLARFNSLKQQVKGYLGMPITVNGVLFPALILLKVNINVTTFFVVISIALMISKIKFKKVLI
jgi:CDP-diacylglycerol---serine O-phosphatidyltransferase